MATFRRKEPEGIPTPAGKPPVTPRCSVCLRLQGAWHKMSCPVSKHGATVVWVDKYTNKIIKDIGEI